MSRKIRKKKEETLPDVVEEFAEVCQACGEKDLATVLYAYLESERADMETLFAEHCKDFSRSGVGVIAKVKRSDVAKRRRRKK